MPCLLKMLHHFKKSVLESPAASWIISTSACSDSESGTLNRTVSRIDQMNERSLTWTVVVCASLLLSSAFQWLTENQCFLKTGNWAQATKTCDTKLSQWGITFARLVQSKANKLEETEQFVLKPSETHIHEYPFLLNKQTLISTKHSWGKEIKCIININARVNLANTDLNTLTGNDHHDL